MKQLPYSKKQKTLRHLYLKYEVYKTIIAMVKKNAKLFFFTIIYNTVTELVGN